ncbi:MAG: antibiotic biosynthesis monooxygenase [Candidatus Brocadiaceae bacterium]|nr:antibiotic biosynthesis monooxygenase [Candidatus Brocadiaceae bacterium]
MSVLSVFQIEVNPATEEDFLADATKTLPLAQKQEGLIYLGVFTPLGEKNKYLVLSEWDSETSIEAWRKDPEHNEVMAKAGQYVKKHSIKRFVSKE